MKIYDDLKWTGNIRKDNGVIREIILPVRIRPFLCHGM